MCGYLLTKDLISNNMKESIEPIDFFIKGPHICLGKRHSIPFSTAIIFELTANTIRIKILLDLRKQILKRLYFIISLERNHPSKKPIEIQCTLIYWIRPISYEDRFLVTFQMTIVLGYWMLITPDWSWYIRIINCVIYSSWSGENHPYGLQANN